MAQPELILRRAVTPRSSSPIDIACIDGRISAVAPHIEAHGIREIDAGGQLVLPPFIDAHFHLDSVLSLGQPRLNQSGTLLEGIAVWGELKPSLTAESILERARAYCHWAIAQGVLAIRSHVDVTGPGLPGVEALLQLKAEMAPWLDIQLVAFPQDGYLRAPTAVESLKRALDMGVEVIGGIPHGEYTQTEGDESVAQLCRLAADRGLRVDLHCDETDDPDSRHIATLCRETIRHGLQGRVVGSHLTSLHSMDNYYASKVIGLMAEAGVAAIANPLINITLQGRHDTYPKRRGLTRLPELQAAGVPVACGHDCVMDPWYPLGRADMIQVASMALHTCLMTSPNDIETILDTVTSIPAALLGLEGYGLTPGCHADMVLLQATSRTEAVRLDPPRLSVIRRGKVIAESRPRVSCLHLGDHPERTTLTL